MPDVFTKAKRSEVMSRIRSRGNRDTELRLIALMRAHGITGWRRNARVFGKPDFVFRVTKLAVFVDGCFWHGCPRHATMPRNNRAFWKAKLTRNAQRDRAVSRALRAAGWCVLRVWECALSRQRSGRTIARLARALGRAGRLSLFVSVSTLLPLVSICPSSIQPFGEAVTCSAGVVSSVRVASGGWRLEGVSCPGEKGVGLSPVKTRCVASLM